MPQLAQLIESVREILVSAGFIVDEDPPSDQSAPTKRTLRAMQPGPTPESPPALRCMIEANLEWTGKGTLLCRLTDFTESGVAAHWSTCHIGKDVSDTPTSFLNQVRAITLAPRDTP